VVRRLEPASDQQGHAASLAAPAHLLADGQWLAAGDELDADVALLSELMAMKAQAAGQQPAPTRKALGNPPRWWPDFT
jgi:hypothetical protein